MENQVKELLDTFSSHGALELKEKGRRSILLPSFGLVTKAGIEIVDLCFCFEHEGFGYVPMLFFSRKINTYRTMNWQSSFYIHKRNWEYFSYRIHTPSVSLQEKLFIFIREVQFGKTKNQ